MTSTTRTPSSLSQRLKELVNFGAVGGVAYIVDLGVYNLLRTSFEAFADSPIKAKIISVAVATIVSWLGNRFFTFKGRGVHSKGREFMLFAVINVIGIGIQLLCLWFSHYVLHFQTLLADNISGNFVGVILGMIFRYLAYRHFVFPGDLEAQGKAARASKADHV